MNKKIFSLSSPEAGITGYAAFFRRSCGAAADFRFSALPGGELLCLAAQREALLCGAVSSRRSALHCELPPGFVSPSFGVFDSHGRCLAFNGCQDGLTAMCALISAHGADGKTGAPAAGTAAPPLPQNARNAPSYGCDGIEGGESYYMKNKAALMRLCEENPAVTELEDLMPGSRWVSLRDGSIAGIIFDENSQPLYICRGIGGTEKQQVPGELAPYCSWLAAPLSGRGWWVIYQSAASGETLKV